MQSPTPERGSYTAIGHAAAWHWLQAVTIAQKSLKIRR
jgi:hypothetical protein